MLTAGGCTLFWPAQRFLPVHVHVGESGIAALCTLNCLFFFDSPLCPFNTAAARDGEKKRLTGDTVIKELGPPRQGWKSNSFASLQVWDSTDRDRFPPTVTNTILQGPLKQSYNAEKLSSPGVHPSQQLPSWIQAEHTGLNSVRCCKTPSLDLVCTELCSEPQEERLGLCGSWKGCWPLVREFQGPTMVWVWIKRL